MLAGSGAHVNSVTNRFYAGQLSPSAILVYDGVTNNLLNTIPVSGCAIEAVVDSSINRVYGAAQCGGGNDPVFVIDGATDSLLATVGSGGVMGYVAANPASHMIYISPSSGSKKIDPNTFQVSSSPFSGTVFPGDFNLITNRIYVA